MNRSGATVVTVAAVKARRLDYVIILSSFSVYYKTEAVNLALCRLACQPTSREEAIAMRGAQSL